MNRRRALSTISIVAGGGMAIPSSFLSSCRSEDYTPVFFSPNDLMLLREIAETILPATSDTPGAGESGAANFIDIYVADCYGSTQQVQLENGLIDLKKQCKSRFGRSFLQLTNLQKHDYITAVDKAASEGTIAYDYFIALKNLVLFAYFTSEIGATQALRYLPIPGKYIGDYPLKRGDKIWAL